MDQYQQVPEINAKLNYVLTSSTVLLANVLYWVSFDPCNS